MAEGKESSGGEPPNAATVSGIRVEWDPDLGTCLFEKLPVAMMWVNTTLAGLMSGMQTMVGTRRFRLALQAEGRASVEADWKVISASDDFNEGFRAIATIAAVAGWGHWELTSLDRDARSCIFRVQDSWEGLYQKTLGVCWGSGLLAGKMAGYASKLFETNCWTEQTAFIARGDPWDVFVVKPSERDLETEIGNLLSADEATRADMAVALQRLRLEVAEREAAEEALRQVQGELESRVQQRTHELAESNRQLRESEERYRSIVESSPMGIFIYRLQEDDRLELVDSNPAADTILGVELKPLVGKTIEEAFPPLADTDLPELYREVCRTGIPWHTEQVDYQDENIRGAYQVYVFRTAPNTIAVLFLDVTARRRIEDALRRSENRFRLTAEVSPFPMAVVCLDSTLIEYVNPAFEQAFGYVADEIPDLESWRLYAYPDPVYRRKVADTWAQDVAIGGEPVQREFLVTCRNGKVKDVLWRLVLLDENRYMIVGEDLTEGKRAQEEKDALQEMLHRSRKMEAVGLLAGGVAHDLNNILSGIVGYPELLRNDLPPNSPLHKSLMTIQNSGVRAAAVVQDLLTITRGAATAREVSNLNPIVKEYMSSPEATALQNRHPDVSVRENLGMDLLNIRCSPVRVRKCIMNLVTNAFEAVEGRGNIAIETENRLVDSVIRGYESIEPGEYALLRVTDDGEGIFAEDLDRIFEPFYTKKKMGRSGTGLGLAVVWNTAQDHGGYVEVVSGTEGTTFEVYLPATREEVVPTARPVDPAAYQGRGERILIVDDEEGLREIAAQMLTRLGYQPVAVPSGEEALEYLSLHAVDLVLLDMIMPGGWDGAETYERIVELCPGQKAIITSGFAATEDVKRAQRLGAGPYLKKPYGLEALGLALRAELMLK